MFALVVAMSAVACAGSIGLEIWWRMISGLFDRGRGRGEGGRRRGKAEGEHMLGAA